MYTKEVIRENIARIRAELDGRALLLAATKTIPPELINYAADCGITSVTQNGNEVRIVPSDFDIPAWQKASDHMVISFPLRT